MEIHFKNERRYWKLTSFLGAQAILLIYFLLAFPSSSTGGDVVFSEAILSIISYGGLIALWVLWISAPYVRTALGEQELDVEKMLDYGTFFSGFYGSFIIVALYDRFLTLPNTLIDTGASFAGFTLGFLIFWMTANALIGRKLGLRQKFKKLFLIGEK